MLISVCSPSDAPSQAIAEMKKMSRDALAAVKAKCFRHNRLCSAAPTPDDVRGLFHCHVAGIQCIDWSQMSQSRKGWCGRGAISFLAWAAERWHHDVDDMILIECVRGFPHTVLEQIFSERYELRFVHASPLQVGIPASRTRKYMCLLKKTRWQWLHGASNDVFMQWYAAFFASQCEVLQVGGRGFVGGL